MKIIIDARESGTSTGRYLDKLIEYLHALEPAHNFVLLAKPQQLDFLRSIAPTFKVQETTFAEFSFGEQLGFMWQIKKLRADLVFFPMVHQPVLYRGKVVTTMQDLTGVRFRNPSKNWLVFTFKWAIYKLVNKYVARKSAQLITPSEFVKQDIVQYCHISPNKVTVTLESADKITVTPEAIDQLVNKQFIFYTGRPLTHKNLPRLVDAFVSLQKAHPDLVLALVGKQAVLYQRIEANAVKRKLSNIIFTGFVSEGQLRWLYENARAYAFPSLSEGFGLPGLEAMVHGCPVVSSNATCLPEVYGDAAHYFDPLDTEDMAQKINEVLTDENLRKDLISKGHAQAAKYSWKRMAEQTLAVYNKVLG